MDILKYFSKLYKEKRELALLEWVYLVVAVAAVLVAGVLALFNQAVGISILIVPLVIFIAMAINMVAWALIKLMVDALLAKESKKPTEKK